MDVKNSQPRRTAVIDIGSNSIKLIIGEAVQETVATIEFLKNIIPIGRNTFYSGMIAPETTKQIIFVLENYKRVIRQYDVSATRVIATTAIREARNKNIFIDTVRRKTGYAIDVLTVGDVIYYTDAYLSYQLHTTYPLEARNVLIAELGSGSLDISVMEKGFAVMTIGLPVGMLRIQQLMSKLDGSIAEVHDVVEEYIENEFQSLKRLLPAVEINDVFLIDESYARYLPQIAPDVRVNGNHFQCTQRQIEAAGDSLHDMAKSTVEATYTIPLEYADTMSAYTAVLNGFFTLVQNDHITIVSTALAEAVLAHMLLSNTLSQRFNKMNQLSSIAQLLCRKFSVDAAHAEKVAQISRILFDNLKGHLGLRDPELIYLLIAAYLHDAGMFIHNRAHHKHSEYIIMNLDLFRLTEAEMRLIACVARYHRKALPRGTHPVFNGLPPEQQLLVLKLASLLRIANALDCSHKQKIHHVHIEFSRSRDITLIISSAENLLLEKLEFNDKKDLFEEITGAEIKLRMRE
ncbi:MAG: HD domain-containing protein [Candidatus Omnitrophica bacterium]|nr:HD domain-containing protein [Candidatus Omnitrophota bacterium]